MWWASLLMVLLFLSALFLILLVLVQRGKGGGLAGAFGGMGGQSAFGTKAGDTFTKITIGVAAVWILLCMISIATLGKANQKTRIGTDGLGASPASEGTDSPAAPEDGAGAQSEDAPVAD